MVDTKHVFQISGIKNVHTKEKLLRGIHRLGGKYIGGSTYREGTTHLIVSRPSNSEKFLAACAGGIWIVKPEYVRDSERNGAWLPEEPYEVDLASRSPGATNPVRAWRERVASGSVLGAFQGWSVVLLVDNAKRNATIKRILMSGKARVYSSAPPSDVRVTHVLTSRECQHLMSHKETCYSVDHIARHLFGSLWSEEGFNESLDTSGSNSQDCTLMDTCTELEANDVLFADLENQLRDQLSKLERLKRRLVSTEFLNATTADPQTQAVMADFSNVDNLIECGLLTEALEELQGALYPGQLPPVQVLHSLMQHALHGEVQPYFYCAFRAVLHNILRKNPSWGSPVVVKYFQRSLQCPQCKGGPRGLLELSVRFCMCSEPTCHSLPRPASPEQVRFHVELQGLLLQLFQFELQASSMGKAGGSRSSVLVSTFWSVWDRSTLCTRAVQQLAQLLIQASLWARPSSEDWQLRIVGTLHDILAVVVEYWCQEHSRQNRHLVEKGLADLGQYIAILCHDLPPEALQEFIPSIPSVRLRMVTADAVFSHLCSQNGIVTGTEPLSLTKIVSSYLPALVRMSGRAPTKPRAPAVEPPTASCAADRGSAAAVVAPRRGTRAAEEAAAPAAPGGPGLGKQNVPRGLNRVNAAGETLLHRACKTDQVETVLRILPLPGIDVNVKDYAGWTPLHEACNHGSSACVRALLEHCPALHLETQVDGVSPLHDALLNGHLDIAKMLLRYGGSPLLRQRDGHGRTALDLVSSPELREDLRTRAREGDEAAAPDARGSEVRDPPFLETCACLLSCLTLSYALARDVPVHEDPGPRLARALAAHSARRVTAGWGDPALVRHAQDLETLLGAGRHLRRLSPAVRNFPGRHTRVLMRQLEQLESDGAELLGNAPV